MISSSYLKVICAGQLNVITFVEILKNWKTDLEGMIEKPSDGWIARRLSSAKRISRNTDVIRNNSNNRSYCGRRNFCQTKTINLHRQWFRIVILWTLIQLHRRSKQKLYPIICQWNGIVVEDTNTNVPSFSFYVWLYGRQIVISRLKYRHRDKRHGDIVTATI